MLSIFASHFFPIAVMIAMAVVAFTAIFWGRRLSFFERDINQAAREQGEADRQKAQRIDHDAL